ncbi:MAG: hypothetical protein LBM87_06695 [Ruminococcus sp.]|jgi:rRNA maturation protein Nop10|nr:hypothetical protein [Ruminococcus sp.]
MNINFNPGFSPVPNENIAKPNVNPVLPGVETDNPQTQNPLELSPNNDLKRRYDLKEEECPLCRERRYQDGSDDASVSFQTPTKVSPESAYNKVRAHEAEHVTNNLNKAKREGRNMVSQTVSVHTAICPGCGEVYIAGGTTRSVSKDDNRDDYLKQLQEENKPDNTLTNRLKDTLLPVKEKNQAEF